MRTVLQAARLERLIGACGGILIAVAFVTASLIGAAVPAAAQQGFGNMFGYQQQPRAKRRVQRSRAPSSDEETAEKKDKKGKKEEAKQTAPSGAVYAVISLADQHVTVYDRTGRIAQSRVSTGVPGHPTPIGLFSIIGKERYHYSNIYGGAPMPFMQRITWSGVAMHLGVVPNHPASHGCIRLPAAFAPQLWGITQMGSRVVVARRDTVPFEISHPFLPVPKLQKAPLELPGSQQAARTDAPVKLASISDAPPVAVSTSAPEETGTTATAPPQLLNPIDYAKALKERAQAGKVAADQAAKDALEAAQAAGAEARQTADDVRKAEADLKTAEAKLAEIDAQAAAPAATSGTDAGAAAPATPVSTDAGGEAALAAAEASARTAAQSEIDRARAALDEAQRRDAAKSPAAFAAVQAWKDAVAASNLAAETVKQADRRIEPVSVLISKKEGRVFIRQDWKEVYEAPVTFRDPDRPIGTHLFIAVGPEPSGTMQWSAISVPSGATASDDAPRKRSKRDKAAEPAPSPPPIAETASAALDRVELPPGVRERISELLWTGAQIIVSDNPRSYEMDEDTDIIVTTR